MSERFTIRRARASDARAIHDLRSLPETQRYQPLVPGTLDQVERMLADRGSAPLTPQLAGKVQWTIECDSEPAGWVSVDVTSRAHGNASVGYALHPRFHGRGIMTNAVRQVATVVFDPGGLAIERLEAAAAVDNLPSRRVLERAGFRFEGIARGYLILSGVRVDHARYARLHTD